MPRQQKSSQKTSADVASPARGRAGDQINVKKLRLLRPADQRPGQIIFQRPNTPRRQKQLG
jgi:hypothetical protein